MGDRTQGWSWLSALLLAALSCANGDHPKVSSSAARFEPWTTVMSGLPAALLSIWGTSTHDIWAVGADTNDGRGPLVFHFDGSGWNHLETGNEGDLWWVHGFDRGPVFMGGSAGKVLRYENGEFTAMLTPDDKATVFGIWGAAPDDLWAVGSRPDESGFIWRSAGSDWHPVEVPDDLISSTALFKVWGHNASDVRFVGERGLVLAYRGERFELLKSGTDQLLITVHSDGSDFVAAGGRGKGVILEERSGKLRDVAPVATPGLSGVAVRGAKAFAVGVHGSVLARRGTTWELLETGLDLARDLHSVWIDEQDGVWAVGGHVVEPPLVQGVLIHGSGANPGSSLGADALKGPECKRAGECSDEVFCNGEERCDHGECALGEPPRCDDGIECTADSCDERKWGCRHNAPDRDGDGHGDVACVDATGAPAGDDCDDTDPNRYPGGKEVCDALAHDEDCDFATVGDKDDDGDGFVSAVCCNADAHHSQCGPDCDDNDPHTFPSADEVCDGRDNDCDGEIDEGVLQRFFRDADADGYGVSDGPTKNACFPPTGYGALTGDCNDSDPTIHPGAVEVCGPQQIDRDCDGTPNDPPGGCKCQAGSERACPFSGVCAAGTQSCVDEVWSAQCSIVATAETCNGLDDDCDGMVDEEVSGACFEDSDGDGFAASGAVGRTECLDAKGRCPSGWTSRVPEAPNVDCAPTDSSRSPASAESCNGIDDDCDGMVDEGLATEARYIDADGDGYAGTPVQRCPGDPGSADAATDCMDTQALVNPGQQGYFAQPACPQGLQACNAMDTDAWYCRASTSDDCTASLTAARWDYDCNGRDDPASTVSAPCGSGDCSGGCGESGFQPVATAHCGASQSYQVCECRGIQGGGCAGTVQMLPLTCR